MANPEIYVVCLSSYASNRIHSAWIDATQDAWDISEDIQTMLKASPDPNASSWAVHDYNGFYDAGSSLGEHPNLDKVSTAANLIKTHDELASELIGHFCGDVDEAEKYLKERYKGKFDSLADYASNLWEDAAKDIPDDLARYIDYEAMGRDFDLGGEIFTITLDGSLHIFSYR